MKWKKSPLNTHRAKNDFYIVKLTKISQVRLDIHLQTL